MSSTPDSPGQNSQDRRGRFQFSLRSLLLFTLFFALVLTSVLMYRRLAEAERELVELRNIAGYLKVEDESRLHAIALDTYDQWTWKWRVFLPKGKKYAWKINVGDIPIEGVPKSYPGSYSGIGPASVPSEKSVECVVSLAVRKDKDNKWAMPLTVGGTTLIASIPDECMNQMKSESITECLGKGKAVDLSSGEPIVFLRKYANLHKGTPFMKRSEIKQPGIIVWLEEAP